MIPAAGMYDRYGRMGERSLFVGMYVGLGLGFYPPVSHKAVITVYGYKGGVKRRMQAGVGSGGRGGEGRKDRLM